MSCSSKARRSSPRSHATESTPTAAARTVLQRCRNVRLGAARLRHQSHRDAGRWCNPPVAFKGNAAGRIWHFIGDYKDRAQLLFTTEEGAGTIELTIADNDWVRADVFMGEALILRAWIEDPYEEKEFWPDNGDGVGEAPGRISKRGRWLQIETARFPGAASSTTGFWIVEDASD